jgi:hypothetical protein
MDEAQGRPRMARRERKHLEKDQKHKDHWDVSDPKGNKVREVDFRGVQIWPEGPKNKNKRPK